LFKKYVPLCRLLSEAGWRPLNALLPAAANKDISAEQFGDRYVALFNYSSKPATVKLPREMRELVTGSQVNDSLTLDPETCRVLDFNR
jgi:beta-galactosidase GanA